MNSLTITCYAIIFITDFFSPFQKVFILNLHFNAILILNLFMMLIFNSKLKVFLFLIKVIYFHSIIFTNFLLGNLHHVI